jgi:hypothetical protein
MTIEVVRFTSPIARIGGAKRTIALVTAADSSGRARVLPRQRTAGAKHGDDGRGGLFVNHDLALSSAIIKVEASSFLADLNQYSMYVLIYLSFYTLDYFSNNFQ